jgi:hypothetical protein
MVRDVQELKFFQGRFPVQIEVPNGSTLSKNDLENIASLSTWALDPNQSEVRCEGIRSIIMARQAGIIKGGYEFTALQLSGIGHRRFSEKNDIVTLEDGFLPPSAENFMEKLHGTKMSTTYFRDGRMQTIRPLYRALGTYTAKELEEKIHNTLEVAQDKFDSLICPHVEAYGRYLCPELSDNEGPFGFFVCPVPSATADRIGRQIIHKFSSLHFQGISVQEAIIAYHHLFFSVVEPLVKGIRELHDKGRVHHQPHLDNAYALSDKAYLVDWATMRSPGLDSLERAANRTLDLKRISDDYQTIFRQIFHRSPGWQKMDTQAEIKGVETVMQIYSRNPEVSILKHMLDAERNGFHIAKNEVTVIDGMIQWMKDTFYGADAYTKRKIGRNVPCPCNSGLKYKKCCGR